MNFNQLELFMLMLLSKLCSSTLSVSKNKEYCHKDSSGTTNDCDVTSNLRYLLYDVNRPEGFNLRRDVYLRYAIFAHNTQKLSKSADLENIKLVLPPWPRLYHWTSNDIGSQEQIRWNHFFDIESLKKFAPVIEIDKFFQNDEFMKKKMAIIEQTYTLENFDEMFETGFFENKYEKRQCKRHYKLDFFGFSNITTNSKQCLAFQGHVDMFKSIFQNYAHRAIMINHAEIALHDEYGTSTYWMARRSMRFNKALVNYATKFREIYFNSTNENDGIDRPDDWRLEKPHRNARGGKYLCAHLRRKDFIRARPKEIPNLEQTAKQLKHLLNKLKLTYLFIATDAPENEFNELIELITANNSYKVTKFEPTFENRQKFKDGGIAIIDQIVCSHAAYFVGSYESTFSFRIQEEREILGFKPETTFNRLCGSNKECQSPAMWKIVF